MCLGRTGACVGGRRDFDESTIVVSKTKDVTTKRVCSINILMMAGHRKSRMRGIMRVAKEREGREEEESRWE